MELSKTMMTKGLDCARIRSSVGLYTNREWRRLWSLSLFALQWARA